MASGILELIPVALALAGQPLHLEVFHSPGYDLLGSGTWFDLRYIQPGLFGFSCRHWLLPDGEYVVPLGPSDSEHLMSLIADMEATSPSPPEHHYCQHRPDFGVRRLTAHGEFSSNVCVESLRGSRFEALHVLVTRLVRTNCNIVRYAPASDFEIIDTRTGKPSLPRT